MSDTTLPNPDEAITVNGVTMTPREAAMMLHPYEPRQSAMLNSEFDAGIELSEQLMARPANLADTAKLGAILREYHSRRLAALAAENAKLREERDRWMQAYAKAYTDLAAANKRAEEAEAVIEKLPKTADGVPISPGMTVYMECPDPKYWRVEAGTIIETTADSITVGRGFKEYSGEFTICGEDLECGNLDFYSTREAALAAKGNQGEGK